MSGQMDIIGHGTMTLILGLSWTLNFSLQLRFQIVHLESI